jgi:hypothetical protein
MLGPALSLVRLVLGQMCPNMGFIIISLAPHRGGSVALSPGRSDCEGVDMALSPVLPESGRVCPPLGLSEYSSTRGLIAPVRGAPRSSERSSCEIRL